MNRSLVFLMFCFCLWGVIEHERRVFFKKKWQEAKEIIIIQERCIDSLNIQIQQNTPIDEITI